MIKQGFSLETAAEWMGSSFEDSHNIYGVAVDSRKIHSGDLFFACQGQRVDGHQFLEEAVRKKAVAAVVKKDYEGPSFQLPLIRVESPEKALQTFAKRLLSRSSSKIIAVTGSVGKTTTKEFIAHLLSSTYRVACSPGNQNSQLGLPLTILNEIPSDVEVIVLEMAMNCAGQIATLVQIAPPDIAIITAVSFVHAENFSSLEEITMSKAEILSHSKTRLGLIDSSISNYEVMKNSFSCSLQTFGLEDIDANWSLIKSERGLEIWKKGTLSAIIEPLRIPGKHNQHNFLAAALAAHYCGVSWESIKVLATSLTLPSGRMQIQKCHDMIFINDAYNAAPISMKAAFDSLPIPESSGRKIVVLGAMLELGAFAEQLHKEIAEYALQNADAIFCLGEEWKSVPSVWSHSNRPYFCFFDLTDLKKQLEKFLRPHDVVLVKGSHSSGISEVFTWLTSI